MPPSNEKRKLWGPHLGDPKRETGKARDWENDVKKKRLMSVPNLEDAFAKEVGKTWEYGPRQMTLGNEALKSYSCPIVGGDAAGAGSSPGV